MRLVGGPAAKVRQRETALTGEGSSAPVRRLLHGRTAGVEIWWSNWCAPGNRGLGKLSPPPTGVEVTLPSGDTVRLSVRESPRCDQPQQPSTLAVGAFRPRG